MKEIIMRLIASSLSIVLFAASAHSTPQHRKQADGPSVRRQERFSWAQRGWTGDNRPYSHIRQEVGKAIVSGQKIEYLLSEYQKSARSSPNDAKKQFAWACVAWQARKRFTDFDSQYRRISGPRAALARVNSPHTYEFLRIRFLLEAWAAPLPGLETLGQRLIRHNSSDYDVKYYLVKVLCRVPTPEAKQQALNYVNEFIQSNPKKISYYLNLGTVYNLSWYRSRGKNKVDGVLAVKAYQKYLQLSPVNDRRRKAVEEEIRYIRLRQAKWDKKPSD